MLGENIVQKERQLYQLKELYVQTIEGRNICGVQLVQRNDELCAHYDKLHTQEAVQKEAEMYLTAREEDQRVLKLMQQELFRDREILQRRCLLDLPALVEEKRVLLEQVTQIKLENEELLNDIRTTAAVKSGSDKISVLDLTSLYNKSKPGSVNKPLRQPLQQLGGLDSNKVYATWNMVGNLKQVEPSLL